MIRERHRFDRVWVGVALVVGLSVVVVATLAAVEKREPPAHVAYISVQRVAAQTTRAVEAAKGIQQFREQRAREINEKRKEVEALRLRIAQLGGVFQGSKRAEARQQETRAVSELQRLETEAQTKLQTMQRDAQGEFQRDLSAILADFARQRGIDLVLNQDASVVWSRTGFDWTDDVARAMNARHEK